MNYLVSEDTLANLRWAEFPNNAREALNRIEKAYKAGKKEGRKWSPEPVIELVNQFVFNLFDSRDLKQSRLSTMQKLTLADIILAYLSFPGNEVDRQTLFNTIFYSPNFYKGDVPLLVLSLVTSLAVGFRNNDVLKCIGVWMVAAGIDSQAVLYIAGDITKDFVTDEFSNKYDTLPKSALLFSAVILIAIGKTFRTIKPPSRLVKQVTLWIEQYPSVCFVPPHSAIFEIFRWCMNSEDEDPSRLHFALITAIERAGKGAHLQVIPHVMTLIQELRVKKEQQSHSVISASASMGFGHVEASVDRLFQLIQMLISSECLERNEIQPIFDAAEEARLPPTPFYELMKGMYMK